MAKIEKADFNSQGDVGQNIIWDGPLSQEGRPHGQGSSSGITGMKLKLAATPYSAGPITMKAQAKEGGSL
jgi:hypothetical protein